MVNFDLKDGEVNVLVEDDDGNETVVDTIPYSDLVSTAIYLLESHEKLTEIKNEGVA